jgi:hypothetical protein
MESSNSSINQQQQATDGTTPPPAPDTNQQGGELSSTAPNLTKTKYDVMADAVLQDIAALRAALPQAGVTETLTAARRKGRTNVSREFLVTAVEAVAASPQLRAATQLDPDRGQETLQLLDAFGRVVTAFEQFASDVKLLLSSRRGELTDHSREAYGVAKGLVRSVKGIDLLIHVRKMKVGARFNNGRLKKMEGGNQPNQGA